PILLGEFLGDGAAEQEDLHGVEAHVALLGGLTVWSCRFPGACHRRSPSGACGALDRKSFSVAAPSAGRTAVPWLNGHRPRSGTPPSIVVARAAGPARALDTAARSRSQRTGPSLARTPRRSRQPFPRLIRLTYSPDVRFAANRCL